MRSLAEWALALGACAALIWAGSPLLRRLAPPLPAAIALVESPLPALPAGVPAGAEPVPMLMLIDGAVVRLGMPESSMGRPELLRWMSGPRRVERGVLGERLVVPFVSQHTRFWVVLDHTEPGQERRVTAIYVG